MAKIIYHALNRQYDGSQDFKGEVEHVEHYEIGFDTPPEDEIPCYLDSRSPVFGDEHPNDPLTAVTALEATSTDGVKFDLAVTYSRVKIEDRTSPLRNPAKVTARSVQQLIWTTFNWNGTPVRNKAGDKFGARQVHRSFVVISFRKNLPVEPWPGWLFELRDAVNQSAVRIKGRTLKKWTLRADNIVIGEEEEENDIPFVPVSFDLTYNRDTWREQIINEGLHEIKTHFVTDDEVDEDDPDSVSGEEIKTRERIMDGTPREPVREPVFLDRNGAAYHKRSSTTTSADPVDTTQPLRTNLKDEEIIMIEVQNYRELNLNVLPMR